MKKNITLFLILLSGLLNTALPQWVAVNNGLTNLNTTSITFYQDTFYVSTTGGGVFYSANNGDNWTAINSSLGNLNVNTVIPLGLLLAGTEGGVYIKPAGTDWVAETTTGLTNTNINFITLTEVNNDTRLTVATAGGIFRKSSTVWESVSNGLTGSALNVHSLSGYHADTIQYGMAGTDDGVYYTFDELASWVPRNNGLTGNALFVNGVYSLGVGAFAATNNGLYFTSDVGQNWAPFLADERVITAGISYFPGTNFAIYAFGDNGFYSSDFENWVQIDMTGVTGGYVRSYHVTQTHIFVVTQTGGVFRRLLSELTSVNEISSEIPENYSLSQNYPNPFNPLTKIRFAVPTAGNIQLKVYDILGKEVAEIVNEYKNAGVYEADFNSSGLASGVYFYKLTSGSYTKFMKMTLLK